jgi:outer membrane protein OmpA-like peptidoglycan-associated protein
MYATRAVVYAALVSLAGCATSTSTAPSKYPGYAVSDITQAVRTGTGDCVRAGTPDPSIIVGECEPERVARQAPPPEPAPEPAAEAPPPEPAETAVAPVPPPEPQRTLEQIVLGTDAYFGFDQAELTEQARAKLDKIVVERARNAEDPKVRIVGHADRIGEADYNMSLSQRRADAVRTYLVQQGMNETAIEVDARGETDPIVQCQGNRGASLIDCLQVNRRSEIEFSALEPVER